jgi:hypothetical protein
MKPAGIVVASVSLAALVVLIILDSSARRGLVIAGGVLNTVLLLGWILVFTPGWVRVPAEACAERLLETCEAL